MKLSNELKVGAVTALAITTLILGFSYLKGATLFAKSQKLYVLLENASSVSPASPVAMHGIKIGKVSTVKQQKRGDFNVIFDLTIDKGIKIPTNSEVQIVELDLLGSKELRIIPSGSADILKDGDTIIGTVKGGMMAMLEEQLDEKLGPLLKKTEPLIESIDTLVKNVNSSLMENGVVEDMMASLKVSLKNLESITKQVDGLMASQTSNIEGIISNANTLTASIAGNSGKIDSIITNFNTLSGKLSQLEFETIVANANASLEEIKKLMTALNSAEGTLGKLLYEDGIYQGLDSTLIGINALIEDLKANPKRYVSFSLIARKEKPEKE